MGKWIRNLLILIAGVTLASLIGSSFVPRHDIAQQQAEVEKQTAELDAKIEAEEAKTQSARHGEKVKE